MTSFIDLGQAESDTWHDVYGHVIKVSSAEAPVDKNNKSLMWKEVVLRSGILHETLELLGPHATINVAEGEKLAARGVKVGQWNHVRKPVTSFLAYIEVNPERNPTLVEVEIDLASPSKKACYATGSNLLTRTGSDAEDVSPEVLWM